MYLYVDTSALAHAAAHGMRPEDAQIGPVQVAVQVVSQVSQFVKHYHATRTYFCFDSPVGNWRKHVAPVYKANRIDQYKQDPERQARKELAEKALLTFIPELVDLLEVPRFGFDYCEADDCAAAVVAMNSDKPGLLVTTDKDYWQLINSNISFINPIHQYKVQLSQTGTLLQLNADGSQEDLGITPNQWLLVKAFMGDKSDNLHGLCGCGEGTALQVVREGRGEAYLAEQTGMVTPRKSKTNPNPQPFAQDARQVAMFNLSMMSLLSSRVHDKVKSAMATIEGKAVRDRRTNLTRLGIWLEQRGLKNPDIARTLSAAFTDQWIV